MRLICSNISTLRSVISFQHWHDILYESYINKSRAEFIYWVTIKLCISCIVNSMCRTTHFFEQNYFSYTQVHPRQEFCSRNMIAESQTQCKKLYICVRNYICASKITLHKHLYDWQHEDACEIFSEITYTCVYFSRSPFFEITMVIFAVLLILR